MQWFTLRPPPPPLPTPLATPPLPPPRPPMRRLRVQVRLQGWSRSGLRCKCTKLKQAPHGCSGCCVRARRLKTHTRTHAHYTHSVVDELDSVTGDRLNPRWTPYGPPMDPLWTGDRLNPRWTPYGLWTPLWNPYGPPTDGRPVKPSMDPLWTPYGPPVDPLWTPDGLPYMTPDGPPMDPPSMDSGPILAL